MERAGQGAGLERGADAAAGGGGAQGLRGRAGGVREAARRGWNGAVLGGAGEPSREGVHGVLHQRGEGDVLEGCEGV